ncbi:MAG: sn-glycerol-1-phosphate dehydrogenase [Oscillospiraceae bacterium]|jgi:glycerol-1-phosphate dehydrogenase [NAD(P)+]|nr:sn-glycerol-1-phosphate dehydrogenase [Oscillospiraceae bacterium]
MIDFAGADLETLIRVDGADCGCGRRHAVALRFLRIGSGAIQAAPEALCALGKTKPFVVCDENTYEAAGKRVTWILNSARISHGLFVFPGRKGKVEPDERAVGALTMAYDPSCDSVMAVGSGVINDCCKVLAHAAGVPSIAVGTAPSMDGYASNSSSMIRGRIKVSLYNECPAAIICDTDVMRRAPMEMLLAGLGDMLAKYVAICEWRISRIVTGEYYCENVAGLMRRSLRRCVESAEGLVRREAEAVGAVAEGLALSGVAMSFAKISRPASGLEHYFSHMWEMMALERGEDSALHGVQCGVGTALTLRLIDRLRTKTPDKAYADAAVKAFDERAWETRMRGIFGRTADSVISAVNSEGHQNDPDRHEKRISRIVERWPEILSIMDEELPNTDELTGLMRRLGMSVTPSDLGISAEDTSGAYIGSRVIRDKYLTSSLIWDLGYENEFAELAASLALGD